MVRNLDDFDQIPIAFHMTEQIPVHALNVSCIKNHPRRSMTGRTRDLAAFVEMSEKHARQCPCVRWFEAQREAFRRHDICCPTQIGDHRLDLSFPRA